MARKKSSKMLSSYTIIVILIVALAILSWIIPNATYHAETLDGRACIETYKESQDSITSCEFENTNGTVETPEGSACTAK